MITYRIENLDSTNTILWFAEGFTSAYDAITMAYDEHKAWHDDMPTDSLFYISKTFVWMYRNGVRYRLMCSFN